MGEDCPARVHWFYARRVRMIEAQAGYGEQIPPSAGIPPSMRERAQLLCTFASEEPACFLRFKQKFRYGEQLDFLKQFY